MKRLFGLIGFTFLFVLSAVFYSDFNEIVFAIIGSLGVLSVAVGIFLIKYRTWIGETIIKGRKCT